jgi:hypothetical protein
MLASARPSCRGGDCAPSAAHPEDLAPTLRMATPLPLLWLAVLARRMLTDAVKPEVDTAVLQVTAAYPACGMSPRAASRGRPAQTVVTQMPDG